jgi:hypothetical protein|tara:strand:- start:2064 stop:2255 length:192 start_codon:yes stop_codon:yes gene_type:complete
MTEPDRKLQTQENCISKLESFYIDRMTKLVDQNKIPESMSIFEEFVVDHQEPEEWLFIGEIEE